MPPLLSVIIPCFNAQDFLRETVASLQTQTYRPIEIILVNDGSRDGTGALCDELQRESGQSGQIPILTIHQTNAGPSAARNAGIAAAKGQYIGFLDADDRWHDEKAAVQLDIMEKDPGVGLTFSGWQIITEDGKPTRRGGAAPAGPFSFEALLYMNMIATPSTVIARTSLLRAAGGFEPSIRYAEDLDLWLRLALDEEARIVSTGTRLIDRRERAGQATKQWAKMYEGWLFVFERIRKIAPGRVDPVANRAIAMNERYCAFLAYEAGDYAAARKLIFAAWKRDPIGLASNKRSYPTTLAVLATLLPLPIYKFLTSQVRRRLESIK